PEKIALPRLTARAFGGSLQGEIQIVNWNAPSAHKKSSAGRSTAKLQIAHMQVGQMAAAVSTARLPLNKVNLTGSASGQVTATWLGDVKNVVAAMTLDVAPPASSSPREVPVSAHMQATYHGEIRTLKIDTLSVGSRSTHLNASGELGSRSTQAHVALYAANLQELQPVLDALRPGTRIPVAVDGRAVFNGTVFGELDELSARGHLEAENFSTEIAFAGRPGAPADAHARKNPPAPQWIHWDSLVTDVNYSPSGLSMQRGLLRRGKTQLTFSATTSLSHGVFEENSRQLALDLHLENAVVEEWLALAGQDYPLTGVLGADLRATGTVQNLRGSGNLRIAKLTVYKEPFQSFRSQLQFAKTEVQ